MVYYGGTGSVGWIWMGLSMIVFWGIALALVIWAVRSFNHRPQGQQPPSAALGVLEERFARGEISSEEFTQKRQLIQGNGPNR